MKAPSNAFLLYLNGMSLVAISTGVAPSALMASVSSAPAAPDPHTLHVVGHPDLYLAAILCRRDHHDAKQMEVFELFLPEFRNEVHITLSATSVVGEDHGLAGQPHRLETPASQVGWNAVISEVPLRQASICCSSFTKELLS